MNTDSLIEKMGDLTDAYYHALSFGSDAKVEEIIEELSEVQKAYLKIRKKIHPDISPETSRLSSIVNEAKEVVLKDLS